MGVTVWKTDIMSIGRAKTPGSHFVVFSMDSTGIAISIDPAPVRAVNSLGQNGDCTVEDTDLNLVRGRWR